jgi:hypothetical protein
VGLSKSGGSFSVLAEGGNRVSRMSERLGGGPRKSASSQQFVPIFAQLLRSRFAPDRSYAMMTII